MGNENESLDEFVAAHKTCVNDLIMFFPTHNAFGLFDVTGNMEKVAALQNLFENVKKTMDAGNGMAKNHEKKIRVLTQGYQKRGETLWSKIEVTFKQIGTVQTELKCFQALQKQEQKAASHRINCLWEEVQKHKELEKETQKEIAAKNRGS